MAYATQDQVLNYLQGGQGQQTQGQDPTSSAPVGGGSGGAFVSGGSNQPGQGGVGGQKLWTNIQSYLTANQGQDQARANQVTQTGQSALDAEKANATKSAQDAKSAADASAKPVNDVGQDKASQLLGQATSAERGSQAYNEAINPVKGALSAQYSGPTSYSYGQSADTQNLGNSMSSPENFRNFLSQFDKNLQGGRDLTTGQRGLQNQLDTQNSYLEDARQGLNSQYGQLTNDIGTGITDTNNYLQNVSKNFTTGQNQLRDYLTGQSSQNLGAIDNAVSDFNKTNANTQNKYDQWMQAHPVTTDNSNPWETELTSAWKNYTDPNGGWGQKFQQDGIKGAVKQFRDWTHTTDPTTQDYLHGFDGFDPNSEYTEAPTWEAGTAANAANVAGVDQQRNSYNALMDMLGQSNIINKDSQQAQLANFKPGFTTGVYSNDDLSGIRSWIDQGNLWL